MSATGNMGNSQRARDIMLLAPFCGFVAYLLIFWSFVFYAFAQGTLDLKDPTTVGLLTTTINQGFNLAMFAAGYVYFREQSPREPARRSDTTSDPPRP